MKKIYIKKIAILSLLCAFTACNDYLDQMPDNRAEIDTEEKVAKLLVSAYPTNGYVLACEMASDNVDDQGHANPYYDRFGEQLYRWNDVTETNNESPKRVWEACYGAIACANQALSAMEEMAMTPNLAAAKGEALISRAYAHFILVNMFCHNYDERYSESDLGIPYMTAAETELNPKCDRGTVADVYRLIEKDVEEGLPLINDAFYTVPKYHMNQKAAYTFASRFYLFYKKFDKVISCANVALGAQPSQLLRDYVTLASYPRDLKTVSTAYSGTAMKSNFLVQTAYSSLGLSFGAYYTGSRFNHGSIMAIKETYNYAPWGVSDITTNNFQYFYKLRPY
ncbi:MAG: RagB/SusD family nutrient uptake outer membrane protein, partial [Phocaeicola sp.]